MTPHPAPPDPSATDDGQALLALEGGLREATEGRSWVGYLACPLLAEHNEDALCLTAEEILLAEHLPSIAAITHRFVTRLSERAELVPVGRVRRPARRALERLAGHTEDWATRNLSGPIPRQALAVHRIDNPDLYENRMVCELVHPILTSHLAGRLRQLRRVQSDLLVLAAAPHEGTHRRQQRLYAFWGGDITTAERSADHARGALHKLEALFERVSRLRTAPLATQLRGRTTGRRQLRVTNVIADEPRYHAAGLVWQAFERQGAEPESIEERGERIRNSHEVFRLYVAAMVVRALDNLSTQPGDDDLPLLSDGWTVRSPWGPAVIRSNASGAIAIESAGRVTRIAPLLDLLRPEDVDEAFLDRWAARSREGDAHEVVVYLGPSARATSLMVEQAAQLSSAGPDLLDGDPQAHGIPVSPLESTSLERLSRAVCRAVLEPALLAFPPQISDSDEPVPPRLVTSLLDAGIGQVGLSPLFALTDPRELRLRRPMTSAEGAAFTRWHDALSERTRRPGWEKDHENDIGRLPAAVDRATETVAPLLTCPACGHRAEPGQMKREGDVFRISCAACRTSWGLERCGQCADRIPILEATAEVVSPEVMGPGWVERVYGQEALASPCWARISATRYVCPSCGSCAASSTSEGEACLRCRTGPQRV